MVEIWPHVKGVPLTYGLTDETLEVIGKTRIVSMGDSLLARSIPPIGQIETELSSDIYWLQIFVGGKDLREFRPFLSKISKLKPDVILVQDQILQLMETNFRIPFREKARMSIGFVRNLILGSKPRPRIEEFEYIPPPLVSVDDKVRRLEEFYSSNVPIKHEAIRFLTDLKKISDRVIVVNLPRSDALFAGDSQLRWQNALTSTLGRMGIEFETLGKPLPESYYFDGSHPNQIGRAERSEMFIRLMKEQGF